MATVNGAGIRMIVVQVVLILVSFAILFAAAGTVAWVNGWVYFALALISQIVSWMMLARVNPELLNARSTVIRENTKGFDRAWMALYPVLTLANLIVIGFDAVRFHWTAVPVWLSVLGGVLLVPAFLLAHWAMSVNQFFEWSARIQADRGQQVCSNGPYRFVRHPGYIGLIVSVLIYPLILGSYWGMVLSAIVALIVVARTAMEDRALRNELPGYREYALRVRYRLVPLIR